MNCESENDENCTPPDILDVQDVYGYQAKKAKTLNPGEINKFINEASDSIYLVTKICSNATRETASSHRIVIDNVKNGEILSYSLLICKGYVENIKDSKCRPSAQLLIKTTHNEITNLININLKTNRFKFIIDLKFGINVISLFFCCTSTSIALEFKLRNTNLCVIPLYIICKGHDGKFQAPATEANTPESACKRIITGCKLIQSLFAEKLYEAGLGRKTFQLNSSSCLVFHSQLHFEKAYKMGQLELWYYFAREIMASSIGSSDKKYLVFLSCTNYNGSKYSEDMKEHSEIIKLTQGYVAFGGEGLALLGTACLYTWPQNVLEIEKRFEDESVVDRSKFMDDSCYRGTLGTCFSTTLGSALHELSHTFGLGHSETGIMGRGFDNIQNVFLLNNCDIDTDQNKKANVNLSKSSYIKNNHKGSDDTYWTENCLLFLSYHKWFNDFNTRRKYTLKYDSNIKIIKSTAGLRVVEVRKKFDEIVLQHWLFTNKVLKYSYRISDKLSDKLKNSEDMFIVVEDNEGNILKENF